MLSRRVPWLSGPAVDPVKGVTPESRRVKVSGTPPVPVFDDGADGHTGGGRGSVPVSEPRGSTTGVEARKRCDFDLLPRVAA